jgi:site-specific DNA-methyltransferase (adenine-specific)
MKINDNIEIYNSDCLEEMKNIKNSSIDLILCDLPYGTTACSWDVIIPFDKLWEQYNRIAKDNCPILLFSGQPFTSLLVCSNLKMFKTEWIWKKKKAKNYTQAKRHPMKYHETIVVFGKKTINYFPIMVPGKPYKKVQRKGNKENSFLTDTRPEGFITINEGLRYPSTIVEFNQPEKETFHPTQKPIELLEYFIKTYSRENAIILDNCMGAASTGIACINTGRKFIGIEKDKKYFDISLNRINNKLKEV